jgi:DNA-directed RNA polymerase specialized sigma24 family protein
MTFPATRYSAVRGASSADQAERTRAWDRLAAAYWQPVYKYVQMKWGADDSAAKDLAQGFFAAAIEKNYFAGYDPAKARFRTFLRTCLDGYVSNERKAAACLKRGGGADQRQEAIEDDLPSNSPLDDFFRDEWVRNVFGIALDTLHELSAARGKEIAYRLFARYDLEEGGRDPEISYPKLAAEFGLPATQVTNHLAWARREFRRIVLEHLREITATDEEFREEAQALLGIHE